MAVQGSLLGPRDPQVGLHLGQLFAVGSVGGIDEVEGVELQVQNPVVGALQRGEHPVEACLTEEMQGRADEGDPHAGDLFCFRGRTGSLLKIVWHDGVGLSLYSKRLEHGRFIWPSPADGAVAISAAQLGYLLDGIDWRNPRHTFRPERVG